MIKNKVLDNTFYDLLQYCCGKIYLSVVICNRIPKWKAETVKPNNTVVDITKHLTFVHKAILNLKFYNEIKNCKLKNSYIVINCCKDIATYSFSSTGPIILININLTTPSGGNIVFPNDIFSNVDVYNVNGVLIGNVSTAAEYTALWNSNPANQAIGSITTPVLINGVWVVPFTPNTGVTTIPLLTVLAGTPITISNFLGGTTTFATSAFESVGVFTPSGSYLGIANSPAEFAALWNANPANALLGSITAPTLINGSWIASFYPLNNEITAPNIIALRYYEYNLDGNNNGSGANTELFLGANDIVLDTSGLIYKASVNGVMVNSDTRQEWNRRVIPYSTFYYDKIPTSNVYTLTVPNPNFILQTVKVFHNEDSNHVGVAYLPGGLKNISGNLPRATKYFSSRIWGSDDLPIAQRTNLNLINNWAELTQFENLASVNFGGTPWGISLGAYSEGGWNKANMKVLHYNNIYSKVSQSLPFLTQANYPNLTDLCVVNGFNKNFEGLENWFLTIPKVSNSLYVIVYTSYNGYYYSDCNIDLIWNNIATAYSGHTPTGADKTLAIHEGERVSFANPINGAPTAASLAARNYLVSLGWTVKTNTTITP